MMGGRNFAQHPFAVLSKEEEKEIKLWQHAWVPSAYLDRSIGQINLSLIVANLCSIPVDCIGANLSRNANGKSANWNQIVIISSEMVKCLVED